MVGRFVVELVSSVIEPVETTHVPRAPWSDAWSSEGRVSARAEDGPVTDHPPYPSGLRLSGRRVLVVGGGHVAQRRVPGLLAAGAEVVIVSPEVTPAIEGQVRAGEVTWMARGFADEDLEETWYVLAATDDAAVNEQVSKACEAARIFCVRADDGTSATAWTPAVGRYDGLTVAVLGRREPRQDAVTMAAREPAHLFT